MKTHNRTHIDPRIARVIKDRMAELGETQASIGHILGVTQTTISSIVNDVSRNPGVYTVIRLLRAVDLHLVIADSEGKIYYRSNDPGDADG